MQSKSRLIPIDMGLIHFIGIGGIGMSGIAEILCHMGYKVQGSDQARSYITHHLEKLGILVIEGQHEQNVKNAALVVKSTDIKDDNPEIVAATKLGIPIIKRSEMLAEVMRFKHCIAVSGTHGKTTTTSLIAKLLEEANLAPTVINGGIINDLGTNARLGEGQLLVAEADESDGTFIRIPAFVAVITNIDPEHLNYWGSFAAMKDAYKQFVENLPFYGFGVLCFDHPEVRKLAKKIKDRKVISYSIYDNEADLMAYDIIEDLEGSQFSVKLSASLQKDIGQKIATIENIKLSMHGVHNVQNFLSAIIIGLKLKIPIPLLQQALANFKGVKRRFSKVANVRGVLFIDDYAHHPVEIIATIKTAKNLAKMHNSRVIVVMQPHRYSRLKELMVEFANCFKEADIIYITEVFGAGEEPIASIDSKQLISQIKMQTQQDAILLQNERNIAIELNNIIMNQDLVLFLGAGSITKIARSVADELNSISNSAV